MPELHPGPALRIGACRFDPASYELTRDGAVQRLPARLAQLLLRLAREPGQPVRRETLIDEVWERRQVNDEVLSRAIADLRQALGDDARAPRCIETLPKLGYRLVAPVSPWDDAPLSGAPAGRHTGDDPEPGPAPAVRPRRRAVRPTLAALSILVLAVAMMVASLRDPRHWPTRVPAPPPALQPARLLQARPFVAAPGRELFPRFTPDARWVVYTLAPEGEPAAPAQLRLRAIDGTEDRALVEDGHDNYCGAASPDGATLAWLRLRPGVCELMHRPLLGGPPRVLAGCSRGGTLAGCPDWTSDGRALLLGGGPGSPGLRAVSWPDGSERVLTRPPAGEFDLQPRVTPEGSRIVFWRGDARGRRLSAVGRHGGAVRTLREGAFLAFGHAHARDGTLVAADDSFGQRALVRIDLVGRSTLLGASDARHPDLAANGALVYEVAHYDANLWRIELDEATAAPRRLTDSARYDSQPRHSPDGAWLAFGSNRDGREGVYMVRSDGREERKLPLDPALRWTSPLFTADGSAVLVQRYDAQGTRLCRHELASARTTCPVAALGERHGAFVLDDGHVGVVDADVPDPRLWEVSLADGSARALDTGGPVTRCRATSRWLLCQRPGRPGLWRQDRRDGSRADILPELVADHGGAWAVQGDRVWFARGGADAGLYRHDLATGETLRVHDWVPSAIGDALSIAPDGRHAVLARTDSVDVDLMLVPPP